jgi:fatty acid desaturase
MFTPIHEASHNLIARPQRTNLLVGHAGAVVLMCPFLAFRHAHLEHHDTPTILFSTRTITLDLGPNGYCHCGG